MDEALANWEPHSDEKGEFMGPMSDAAGNSLYGQYTDYITVRNTVYLPPRYAAMLVSRQIPAAQAWLEIGGAIKKDGLTRECADLLTWLRAANCWGRPDDGGPESRIHIVATTALKYVVPLAGHLATYAAHKIALDFPQVQQKLPDVSTNNMTPEHFAAAMAAALANRLGRNSEKSDVITPQLPSAKFRGLLPLLLKICEVENEIHLPLLYHELANCFKHEQAQVVQHRFTIGAAQESIEHSQIPVATTQIVALITRCDFVGNVTDLNTGLQPFLFTYTSQDANALLREVTSMAADLH